MTEKVPLFFSKSDDLFPLATILSMASNVTPLNLSLNNTSIISPGFSQEALLVLQRVLKSFLVVLVAESTANCASSSSFEIQSKKRLNGDDVIHALLNLGFHEHAEALQIYLRKYREQLEEDKKLDKRCTLQAISGEMKGTEDLDPLPPPQKRLRRPVVKDKT